MRIHLDRVAFALACGVLAAGVAMIVLLLSRYWFATGWNAAVPVGAFFGGLGAAASYATQSHWRWVGFLVALTGFGLCLAAFVPLLP